MPTGERRTRNLQALFEVSRQATANLDQQQMLEVVVQAVQDVMGYHMASILLLDDSGKTLVSSAISSNLQVKILLGDRISIERGIVGQAVRTGKTQLANDVMQNPNYIRAPGTWDPGSELSVPIQAGGKIIGVLDIQDEAKNSFRQEDVQTLETLADQLVVVLEKARLFSDARSNLRDLTIIYEMSQQLSQARTTDETLRIALHTLAEHSRYRCTIALLEFDHVSEKPTHFFVPFTYQPGEGIIELNEFVPTSEDDLNELLDAGHTIAIPDVSKDDRVPVFLQQEQMAVGRPALALIPLVAGRRRIGNLILTHTQPEPWIHSELRLFRLAANLIAISVENTRQFQREHEMTALEERQRLARDLHDSVTQLIFSVMLMAQSVGTAYKRDAEEGERRIARMMELSQQALTEMRALLTELRPVSPVENGLIPAIRQHIERIAARENIVITFQEQNYTAQARHTEEALYRIIQEALNNTLKHAHATHAEITLERQQGQIRLSICDDGRGLEMDKLPPHQTGQFGLQGIRERVARLGGTVALESRPGQGTTLQILFEESPP